MDVDRELNAALDVDPSPDFVARVRARVAHEPPPRELRLVAPLVALAVGAVVVVAIVSNAPVQEVTPPPPIAIQPAQVRTATPVPAKPGVERRDRAPEVIVNASARKGLEELAVALRDDQVDFIPFDVDATFIPVAPMVVEVVPSMTESEGVHQ